MDIIVRKQRDAEAAFRFLRRLSKNQRVEPQAIVADGCNHIAQRLSVWVSSSDIGPDVCARTIE